jgi:4-nitrophenyl phosphatase
MVGDRLDTDILFGNKGGIDTLMVLTGVHGKKDYEKEDRVAMPTYVIDSFGSFAPLSN